MGEKINKPDSIIGLEISGFGKDIQLFGNKSHIFFKTNNHQRIVKRQGVCSIEKPKIKTILPYPLKDLNLAWGKDKQIFGNSIYCECEGCKKHGKIHKRYLKAGKKHGQCATFTGAFTISVVLKPIIRSGPIALTDTYTLDKIHSSILENKK